MRVELPLNLEAEIRTYTYYAYVNSIISAEERIGAISAKFFVADYNSYEWEFYSKCFRKMDEEGGFEFVSDNPYQCGLNGCVYRKLEDDDTLQICLKYQQYSLPWGAVNLFIADANKADIMDDDKYMCRFGFFNWDGLYLWNNGKACKIDKENNRLPLYLLLHRNQNMIEAYAGETESKMKRVGALSCDINEKNWKIGIQIKLNDNAYYNWLYSNFIQISCDITNLDRKIDYYYGVQKDWKWNVVNYFLNRREIPIRYIRKYGCLKFLKECLAEGQYLELPVDQFYLEDRDEYRSCHHYHSNLIYGYDDKKKEFLMEGYTNHGRLTKTKIKYGDLKYIMMKKEVISHIAVFEYRQDGYPYLFDVSYIVMMLKEYLEGINSSYHLLNIVPKTERIYGMHVYKELTSEKGMKVFLSDKRISHLLYEHKVCMVKRIEFLKYKGVLSEESAVLLSKGADRVARAMFNIRNLVVKNQIVESVDTMNQIKDMLHQIEKEEREVITQLLFECQFGKFN